MKDSLPMVIDCTSRSIVKLRSEKKFFNFAVSIKLPNGETYEGFVRRVDNKKNRQKTKR